jgi:ubiquinone/menaquinone biosynthesis C-methylase UbiE
MSDATGAQAFYGRWARLYDLVSRHTPGIRRVRRRAVAACCLESGDTVVEMGCGSGANLPLLREAVGPAGTVVGIDFTRPILDRADALVGEEMSGWGAPPAYDNVSLVRADATAPPIDGAVDAVLATFVVGMLDDPAAAIDRWWELLGPDGHLVLLNARSSQRPVGRLLDPLYRAIVVASTPPTTQLRYDRDLVADLDARVTAAHDRLREHAGAGVEYSHALGYLALSGGRKAEAAESGG